MKRHLKCWLWKGLWLIALVSLVLAWVGIIRSGLVLGVEPLAWFWTALVVGVLAIPIKMDCASCAICVPEGK